MQFDFRCELRDHDWVRIAAALTCAAALVACGGIVGDQAEIEQANQPCAEVPQLADTVVVAEGARATLRADLSKDWSDGFGPARLIRADVGGSFMPVEATLNYGGDFLEYITAPAVFARDNGARFRIQCGSGVRLENSNATTLIVVRNAALEDSTFDAGWTGEKIVDKTLDETAAFTAGPASAGGNPGAFRSMQQSWTGGNGVALGVEVAHLRAPARHEPASQGAIERVDMAFDAIVVLLQGGLPVVGIFPLLRQGGVYYQHYDTTDTVLAAWSRHEYRGLTAEDFTNPRAGDAGGGPVHPDFGPTGGPIEFGYGSANASAVATRTTVESGVDNWSVSLYLK